MARKRNKKRVGTPERETFLQKVGAIYATRLTKKATPWELEFKEKLVVLGIRFYFQYPIICDQLDLYILDFYLPDYAMVFEIDGWQHNTKEGRRKDSKRSRDLKKLGLNVKRIRNGDVKRITPAMLKKYLYEH